LDEFNGQGQELFVLIQTEPGLEFLVWSFYDAARFSLPQKETRDLLTPIIPDWMEQFGRLFAVPLAADDVENLGLKLEASRHHFRP
jgi:hypothetical protein